VLSTLNLHFTGAALTLSRLVESGVSPLRRRLTVLGGLAVVVGLTVAWVWRDLRAPDAEDFAGVAPFTAYLLGLLDHGAALARELGIPCVVGIAGLLATIKSGDDVQMDGGEGWARIQGSTEAIDATKVVA
jgi:hypothetical protein